MTNRLLFIVVSLQLCACSNYHARQGYVPLSSVPDSPHVAPSEERLNAVDALQKAKATMAMDKGLEEDTARVEAK